MNFWRKLDRRGPYKNSENFVLSLIVVRKYFFHKIICSTHQKKCFSTILGNFWKIEFLIEIGQARTLQKLWKFCTILNCGKKIFFGKIICSTHQKKCFSTILGNFLENWILTEIRQARTFQKWWTFCTILNYGKKIFFDKIIFSTHQKKCFSTILVIFWKIEFLTEIGQARTLQK